MPIQRRRCSIRLSPEHPVTGERCLYFSESFTSAILGLNIYESESMHRLTILEDAIGASGAAAAE